MSRITLEEFWRKCPNTLEYPANISLGGGILWRGWVENDVDLAIWGTNLRPKLIEQLQQLTDIKLAPYYGEPYGNCHAPLYVFGEKVKTIPTCPSHTKLKGERIWDLEQTVIELENRLKALEAKIAKKP